ncbi:MAG: hypothetical protein OXK82_05665 [Deltaproteobacteria bacterium]|nr:hypothetical protein [Deltaproteobacteria bacterium]
MDVPALIDTAGSIAGNLDSALSVFKRIRDLAKEGELPVDLAGDFIILSGQIGEAKVELASLQSELKELQHRLEAVDRMQDRKQNYALFETPAGEFVYRLKDDAETGEPTHSVCPTCFQRNEIRILQPRARGARLECDSCKSMYMVERSTDVPMIASRRDRFEGYF